MFFALKLFFYKLIYIRRLHLKSFSLSLELFTSIKIDSISQAFFGNYVYFRRFGDIEVMDGGVLTFSDNCFVNKNVTIVCRDKISIGSNCLMGEGVSIYDHNHGFRSKTMPINQQGFESKPVSIGENVWLGARVFISPGVTVGDNVVIAAGTVVTKDVSSDMVVYNELKTTMKPR